MVGSTSTIFIPGCIRTTVLEEHWYPDYVNEVLDYCCYNICSFFCMLAMRDGVIVL